MKRNIFGNGFWFTLFYHVALLWTGGNSVLADMYISGNVTPNPQRYSRFYEGGDKAFIGNGLDFSGVSTSGPWATMISPQYFITAYHWPANSSSTLTFCEGNTTDSGEHTYSVDTSFQFSPLYNGQPADVHLGRLSTPIPAADHIAYYPLLNLPDFSDYVSMTIYNYGNPNLVGRNVISKIEPYAEAGENGPSMFFNYDVPGVGPDETYLIGGDSGGPSFAVVDGKLALLGEHFSTYGTSGLIPFDGGPPKASDGSWWSVDGFVPAYLDQLDSVLPADQQMTTVVPKSSAWKGPGGGNYNLTSNWTNNVVPNGVDAIANFSTNITAPSAVTLDSPVTLGTLIFNSPQSYTLVGPSSLVLQTSSGVATIEVLAGSVAITH